MSKDTQTPLGLGSVVASESRVRVSGVYAAAQRIGYPAEPTHPPHAIGTQGPGPLGDQITSIEASFVFHPRNPRVKLNAHMLGPPSPVGRTKGSLFGPHWHSQNRPRTSG